MSALSKLKTIAEDIEKGLAPVGAILKDAGGFVPGAGPILVEIGTIITNLENGGHEVNASTVTAITQAVATVLAAKTVPGNQGNPPAQGATS